MKHVTIKDIIKKSDMPADLVRSTIRQFGGFEAFKESASDVVNHGICGGFHGFIYYTDTVAFFKRNREHILTILRNDAECFDQGLLEMVQGFRCLGSDYSLDEIARAIYAGKGDGVAQIYNCLSWYAGETVCRLYTDLIGG